MYLVLPKGILLRCRTSMLKTAEERRISNLTGMGVNCERSLSGGICVVVFPWANTKAVLFILMTLTGVKGIISQTANDSEL